VRLNPPKKADGDVLRWGERKVSTDLNKKKGRVFFWVSYCSLSGKRGVKEIVVRKKEVWDLSIERGGEKKEKKVAYTT